MLDIGWQEFILVAFVLLVVVGPKDLPKVLKNIVNFIKKIKSMASDFQNTVDEIADDNEINDIKKDISEIKNSKSIINSKKEIDNLQKIKEDTKTLLKKSSKS